MADAGIYEPGDLPDCCTEAGCGAYASITQPNYPYVSLVYFPDSTDEKASAYPGMPAFFRQHSQKNILREPYV